ncbi:MAG: DNA-processing protein DprA [bacterium]|nr:DNA-processing protein DprA [bacterium]
MHKAELELMYLAAISACSRLDSITIQELLNLFISPIDLWKANESELRSKGVPDKIVQNLVWWKKECVPECLWSRINELGLKVIGFKDTDYPQLLCEIPDLPIVLYVKGELDPQDLYVAVVGNRMISQYGIRMTERITQTLVNARVVIVSGLALGVDGIAHRVAVQSKAKTVAVLANGLDQVYPPSHSNLAKQILENGGALVSEYSPGTLPLKHHFLERNRIIAGFSMGTLIVEAGKISGALRTAGCALEYGRSVYAVPGDAERPQAAGVNNLIKQGAIPVTTGEDILGDLNIQTEVKERKDSVKLTDHEKLVLDALSSEPVHIDLLAREIKLEISVLSVILIGLEMRDLAKNVGGMNYIKIE